MGSGAEEGPKESKTTGPASPHPHDDPTTPFRDSAHTPTQERPGLKLLFLVRDTDLTLTD